MPTTTKKVTVYTKAGKYSKAARKRAMVSRFKARTGMMSSRQVHWFKRRGTATAVTGDGITNAKFIGLNFTLSSMINAAEFSALFDQYKLTGIKLNFYLSRNPANSTSVNGIRPRLYIVTDYDTSTAPSSFDELREYSNSKVWNFDSAKPFSYFVRPKVLNEVYRSGVSTGTAPVRPPWISTQHLDLQHFGVRMGIENIQDVDYTIVIEPTFYFGVKNVK